MKSFIIHLLSLMFFSVSCLGQIYVSGDSTIVDEVKVITQDIYNKSNQLEFYLTKKTIQSIAIVGSEITTWSDGAVVNRVLIKSFTQQGTLASEYYFQGQDILYIYATHEYFSELKNDEIPINFKGLAYWESRFYFNGRRLAYLKHFGPKEAIMTQKELMDQITKVKDIIPLK